MSSGGPPEDSGLPVRGPDVRRGSDRAVPSAEAGAPSRVARARGLRESKLVIGIPTVRRRRDYLRETLESLVRAVPERDRGRVEIVVFNVDAPPEKHVLAEALRARFARHVERGFLSFVTPPRPHPELDELARQYAPHDPPHDRLWEVKLFLDALACMEHCRGRGELYLPLEDDSIAVEGFYDRLAGWFDRNFAERDDWRILCVFPLEAVPDCGLLTPSLLRSSTGLLFRTADLPAVADRLRPRIGELPLDHAIAGMLDAAGEAMYGCVPALLQHVGFVSSKDAVVRLFSEAETFEERPRARFVRHAREFADVLAYDPGRVWQVLRHRRLLPLPDSIWSALVRARRRMRRPD